jgi:DNA-binding beta-propeller fold protein YncE/cytochrome c peroxidase
MRRRKSTGSSLIGAALFWCFAVGAFGGEAVAPRSFATRDRQPVALAFSQERARLLVANRKSGSLSVVDRATARVVAEHDVGRGLADLVALPDGRRVLVVDQAGDAVLLLDLQDDGARVIERKAVSPDPVGVVVLPDGFSCVVASLGTRRLTFLTLDGEGTTPKFSTVRTLDLPFAPRKMVSVRDGTRLVVADAFGGRLAVVDPARGVLETVRTLPAHNIRGLAVSPDGRTLVLALQTLHRKTRTDFEGVHWGTLLSNHLRAIPVDSLLAAGSDADLAREGRLIDLGNFGNAAGDPAGAAFDRGGGLVVALAGVDEVALARSTSRVIQRVGVGRGPTAVAVSPDGRTVYVADTFDDTISIVDLPTGLWRGLVRLGPRPELDPVARGERLFYDARLSHDGWMSCQSCHTEGHTNSLVSDTLGDGSYGAPKLVPSLLGVGATAPWAWNGSMERLEDQVRSSIETTMRGRTPTARQVEDLTVYLRSLAPPRPLEANLDQEAIARGREVFRARKCADCHAPPAYTKPSLYDVGLADEVGNRRFNPPTLLGVCRRDSFLHDGRAATLVDVFRKEHHPRGMEMNDQEISDLVAFLETL